MDDWRITRSGLSGGPNPGSGTMNATYEKDGHRISIEAAAPPDFTIQDPMIHGTLPIEVSNQMIYDGSRAALQDLLDNLPNPNDRAQN
jgi:hypothetical protein